MAIVTVPFPPFPLHPGQEAFVKSLHPEVAYIGGMGAGKSTALVVRAVLLAHQFPKNRILITRKTYRSLNETTRTSFYEIVPPAMIAGENKSEDLTFIHSVGGETSTIIWRSFEDSPADWQKFRSAEYGAVFIDEASEAPSGLVDILLTRLRARVPYRSINFVSNPTPEEHWLYQRFKGAKADAARHALFHGTTYENKSNLPVGYIEGLEAAYADRPEMVAIILEGKFGHIPTGLSVFRRYRRMLDGKPWHLRTNLQPVEGVRILRGWDFGVVRPAVVWCQFPLGKPKMVLREKLGFNTHTRDFARVIRDLSTEMFPGFEFVDFCDPQGFVAATSNGRSDVDELRDQGINPMRIKKTSPGFRAGLVDDILRATVNTDTGVEPEFQLDAACTILDGAFIGGYRRPEPIPDMPIDDEPMKDGYFEHPVDALGFVVVGRTTMGTSRLHVNRPQRRANARALAGSYAV